MEWIDFRKTPPENDCVALVFNEKGYMCGGDTLALYCARHNVWRTLYASVRNDFTLEVTHYFPVPPHPPIVW